MSVTRVEGNASPACPDCRKPLAKVTRSRNSMLNDEQFDAIRAGDWYCETCPTNGRGNTSYRYFWDRELLTDEQELSK